MLLPPTRQLKKLSEICIIDPKKSIVSVLPNNTKVSFVPMKDLSIEKITFATKEVKEISEVIKGYTYFENNDILLAKVTPCFENGKCGIASNLESGIGFGSSEFIVFRPGNLVISKYIYYYISRKSFREEGAKNMSGAVGLQRIKKSWLDNIQIPLPPLPTQNAIVALLDSASTHIQSAKQGLQQQIRDLDALRQSSLSEVFEKQNHNIVKLGEICDITSSKRIYEHEYVKRGIQFYRGKEVILKSKGLPINDPYYISEQRYNEIKDKFGVPQTGDLLLTSVGTLGIPYIVQEGEVFYFKDGNLTRFRNFNNKIFNRYLVYWFYSENCWSQINATLIGSAQKALTIINLNKFQIPLPPLSTQKSIVIQLNQLNETLSSLKTQYQHQIQSYDALWASILDQAFRGELIVE